MGDGVTQAGSEQGELASAAEHGHPRLPRTLKIRRVLRDDPARLFVPPCTFRRLSDRFQDLRRRLLTQAAVGVRQVVRPHKKSRDPFYSQFLANAEAVRQADVSVTELELENMPHGFGADGGWISAYDDWLTEIFSDSNTGKE